MSDLLVRRVDTGDDFRAFFTFPWKLYENDPNWVPPLVSTQRNLFDKTKNPTWQYCEGDYYAAWRGDRIVGTIAAYVNHRHNEYWEENVAWFGAFEVEDDEEAAHALLDTAVAWANQRNYDLLRGPQTFTQQDHCGLLIKGFERPILLMPYNPPYYQTHIESAGFVKTVDSHSYYGDRNLLRDAADRYERMERLAARVEKRSRITVHQVQRDGLKERLRTFLEIYNTAWSNNWGFVPATEAELESILDDLGSFIDPKLAFYANVDDEFAGFIIAVPDLNQALHRAYPRPGTPEFITLLRTLWFWRVRPVITGMRIPLVGVKHEFRGVGADVALFNAMLQAFRASSFFYWDTGWTLETNQPMTSISHTISMDAHRTYRFYEKNVRPE